jgi:hypothetical protein
MIRRIVPAIVAGAGAAACAGLGKPASSRLRSEGQHKVLKAIAAIMLAMGLATAGPATAGPTSAATIVVTQSGTLLRGFDGTGTFGDDLAGQTYSAVTTFSEPWGFGVGNYNDASTSFMRADVALTVGDSTRVFEVRWSNNVNITANGWANQIYPLVYGVSDVYFIQATQELRFSDFLLTSYSPALIPTGNLIGPNVTEASLRLDVWDASGSPWNGDGNVISLVGIPTSYSVTATGYLAEVPEPATVVTFGLCLLILFRARWRLSQSSAAARQRTPRKDAAVFS